MNISEHTACLGLYLGSPFFLTLAERRRHVYMLGKTGTGKTTLLHNLIVDDLRAGAGLAILDPHGDLAETLLDHVPRHRTHEVIYFAPADLERPVGLNVLEDVPEDYRPTVADGVITAFRSIWVDSWGARLEHFLRNAILALMDSPGETLLGIPLMLTDEGFRARIVAKVRNPIVRFFWEVELPGYPQHYSREAMGPVLNKIESFLVFPAIRNIVGQSHSTFDARFLIDHNRILIANLAKGLIGEEAANLLGSLLVTKIQLAAMSRANQLEVFRQDFTLYADEFHSFTTESFATVLAEARKYRLALVIAHQYLGQLRDSVRDAVFGNIGTMVVFRVGAADGEVFCKEFAPLNLVELTELSAFCAWAKTPEHLQRLPLSTLSPTQPPGIRGFKVREQSRRHFTRCRADVETQLHHLFARKEKRDRARGIPKR